MAHDCGHCCEQGETPTPTPDEGQLARVPGLIRLWELEALVEPGAAFQIEEAGRAEDGTKLYSLFRRRCRGCRGCRSHAHE